MAKSTENRSLTFSSFVFHLHPPKVHAETLRFTLSFGLGGMAATLVVLLLVTGLLQLLSYSPQIDQAYLSIQQMYQPGGLGGFIRNCHYWAGNLLVVITFFHFLRVFLTTAFTGPRRYNWIVGLALFLLVVFANFTGYLMPWDQLAYWAVTIFTSMLSYIPVIGSELMTLLRGGQEVGSETLATFYAIHTGIIPVLMVVLLLYHFWMVRKAGGLIKQENTRGVAPARIATHPHLVAREVAVVCLILSIILLFSAVIDAPLGAEANPGQSPNPAKAAWYFMGLQELLLHLYPSFAICVVPLLVLFFFIRLPFGVKETPAKGVWFGGRKGALNAAISGIAGTGLTFFTVLIDDTFLIRKGSSQLSWLWRGLVPTIGCCLILVLLYFILVRIRKCSAGEAQIGVVSCFLCGAASLTVIGIWLRGAEMALVW
ncbi:cytochrome b N-terminal domain-containing protein [Desulfogranum marinum]|uniref:cytochrome b N-terminal domain-containing protein n=1 Tax=Desulfogranum marinum TaxID=453220 RepID=UPI001964A231|nr:cytochrome b N-terminal domain-containing protein [Desulfogranum marinum]MBM9513479.1 cytochrome b N-terminal domain-containing protein [Desulfogranum marinum]